MSSLRPGTPGPASDGRTRGWWRGRGGVPSGRAGSSGQRKLKRQKVRRHHGPADDAVAAPVREDKAHPRMPAHKGRDILAPQMHVTVVVVVGHLADDVVRGCDQLVQLGGHLSIAGITEAHPTAAKDK